MTTEETRQKEVRLNIRISQELKDKYYNYCQEHNIKASANIRCIIEEWLEARENK